VDTCDGPAQRAVLHLGGNVSEGPEEAVERNCECTIQVGDNLHLVKF
jgi:hypothetical protein